MTAKAGKRPPSERKPDPNERERAAIAEARDRVAAKTSPVFVRWRQSPDAEEGPKIAAPHSDEDGFFQRLRDVFGTRSYDSLLSGLAHLDGVSRPRGAEQGADDTQLNAALALMASIGPTNELEASLAIQMTGCHLLAMNMMCRATHTNRPELVQLYGGLAVKLQRTFSAQIEALAKLRGGGKQQVEVRHVYVNGNAIVGDIHAGRGGADTGIRHQPLAPGLALEPGAPMRSPLEADREPVLRSGGEGSGTL